MNLIKDDIFHLANLTVSAFCGLYGVSVDNLYNVDRWSAQFSGKALADYSHTLDFGAAGWIAHRSQTFLLESDQVLQFLRAIDRKLPPGDYPAPFQYLCIQFTRGIDETLFTTGLRGTGSIEPGDEITGLLIAVPDAAENPRYQFVNVIAWYKSTSLNRIQLNVGGDGTIEYRPLFERAGVDEAALYADKQRIANLAFLCLAYMMTPGMSIEHVAPDAAVNRKREAKGKKPLPDYYVCKWAGNADKVRSTGRREPGAGSAHSFRYDVAGHFRRLPDGRTVWIRSHQRGIGHEEYRPKVYRVD
jgi:hypothetical protein